MEIKKLPFEITPHIKRHLSDILYLEDEGMLDPPDKPDELFNTVIFCFVKAIISGEDITPKQVINLSKLWKYLEKNNSVKRFGCDPFASEEEMRNEIIKYLSENKLSPGRIFVVSIVRESEGKGVVTLLIHLNPIKKFKNELGAVLDYSTSDSLFILNNVKSIEELLEKIKSGEKKTGEIIKPEYSRPSKVTLDPINYILQYKNLKPYPFHQGIKGEPPPPRLRLFLELWRKRRYIKNKRVKSEGEFLNPGVLAVHLEIVDSSNAFSKEDANNLYSIVKDLRRALKDREYPIKIVKNNGYQMIVTE